MAAQGRNDARTAARLLADSAKDCLDHPATAPTHVVVLNNVFRLLEAYRVNTFFGVEPVVGNHSAEPLSLIPPLELHVKEVREVLERAIATAFAGQSKDQAIAQIGEVLKRVAYPEFGAPTDADKAKATRFFSEISQNLQTA